MPLTNLKVIGIMAGRDLERAGAKLHIHVGIVDDGDGPFEHRHQASLTDEMAVPLIIRMDGHG